jgi:hypothetical protein
MSDISGVSIIWIPSSYSRPLVPPGPGDGYETVYVLKGTMSLTLAGKPILFPSPVYVGREYESI